MAHHFILIRADRTVTGGTVVEYTPGDIEEVYTPEERWRLAHGLRVQRSGFYHVDLQATVVCRDLELNRLAREAGAELARPTPAAMALS